jgi:preprotein translocase subunit YajC
MSISKIKTAVLTALTALTAIAFLALPAFAQDDGGAAPPAPQAPPAQTQAPAPVQQGGGELPPPQGLFGGNFLFIMAAMFAIIYFFMIRPEQRKMKERQKMLAALKKGDKVLALGGLVGVITTVKDSTYIVKSGEGAVFEVTKSSITNLLNDVKEAPAADTPTPDAAKENK